jgi:7-carboxy-7-deazaguanine synthase
VSDLLVNEIFGPTLQGEGPSLGRPAAFLRTAGCNLACSWCDTPYTWDFKRFDREAETRKMPMIQVADAILDCLPVHPALLVVSGGEPLLQQPALIELLTYLHSLNGLEVEVETAGTLPPLPELTELVDRFNVSPKLDHSGNPLGRRLRPDSLAALKATGRASWKFVAEVPSDLNEIGDLVTEHHLDPAQVYIMPLGTRTVELEYRLRTLADPVIARGWRLTPRLQINIWGNTRGH